MSIIREYIVRSNLRWMLTRLGTISRQMSTSHLFSSNRLRRLEPRRGARKRRSEERTLHAFTETPSQNPGTTANTIRENSFAYDSKMLLMEAHSLL